MAKMPVLGDKSPQMKKKPSKMKTESHTYDQARPKRQVVSRYSK